MPMHDGDCPACGRLEFFIHITEAIPKRCPQCNAKGFVKLFMTVPPRVRGDIADWNTENGGKGRYCAQAASKVGDPNAYFTSRNKLEDWGKARGYTCNRS